MPNIKAKAVLLGAGRILPVEARHAAWIRDLRFSGGTTPPTTPAPAAFEDGFSKAKILAAVRRPASSSARGGVIKAGMRPVRVGLPDGQMDSRDPRRVVFGRD